MVIAGALVPACVGKSSSSDAADAGVAAAASTADVSGVSGALSTAAAVPASPVSGTVEYVTLPPAVARAGAGAATVARTIGVAGIAGVVGADEPSRVGPGVSILRGAVRASATDLADVEFCAAAAAVECGVLSACGRQIYTTNATLVATRAANSHRPTPVPRRDCASIAAAWCKSPALRA